MRDSLIRSARPMALGLMMMLAPLWVAHGQEQAARYIAAGERLYESLEYERALAQFAQARRLPRTLVEDVRIALFEGLILSDMGMHEEGRSAFKTGLLLDPDARLPVPTTPQVELEFEGIRSRVREELAARNLKQKDATANVAPVERMDAPVAQPQTPAVQLEPPKTPDAPPSWVSSSTQEESDSVPKLPLVLIGAGAVAGGAGSWFGLQSRSHVDAMRAAIFRDDMVARHGDAVVSARRANILFGTAAVLGTSAIVTWLLSSGGESSAEGGGR